MKLLELAGALAVVVPVAIWVITRPQRGLLLMTVLMPFDGLLLIVPGGEKLAAWKEAMTVLVAICALVSPRRARRETSADPAARPPWVALVVALVAFTVAMGVVHLVGGGSGLLVPLIGLKIDFFFLLVPVILWRCPFDRTDLDRLVTILMATSVATAAVGLAQQAMGPVRLNAIGYTYNDVIRFSGGFLRSFSTFTQPFSFGLFVMVAFLVALPVALADRTRRRNQLFLLCTPLLVLGLATSVVRAAALGLAVGLVVLAWWRHRGLAHVAVPVAVTLLLLPQSAWTAFTSSSSLGQRTAGWSKIGSLVVDSLFGHGPGVTGAAAEKSLQLGASPHDVITLAGHAAYQPDSYYVKTLIELGPIGLWLLLLVGAMAMQDALQLARTGEPEEQPLAAGIAASIAAAAAASFVSTYLEIFPLDFYFWLFMGVLLCLARSSSTRSPFARTAEASPPTSVSSSSP